jgi:hypothetical protein
VNSGAPEGSAVPAPTEKTQKGYTLRQKYIVEKGFRTYTPET